ncbi:Os10g0510050 [Oryza sativa Japonica Group]|uniref:Os10g0510050 protein n=1 Tax=Oryza sativa subsp. japonica TaxID=39947 RepID=A0A0P0XWE5_ORYSJ|nr:hypothetical protein EE612_052238 [Oryza sativa]BAT11612.1 Os10g0510050 [Oryza sativa Japonica Group]
MRKGITFVDWDCVTDTISRIQDNTYCTSTSIEGKHGLNSDIHGWNAECLKHNLCHLLPVGLRVKWSLRKKNWMLFWCYTKLIVECVVPNFLHVIPVAYNSMLNGVFQG